MSKGIICLVLVALALASAEDKPLRVEPEVANQNLTRKIEPAVPPLAKLAQVGGTVVADIFIDQSGKVSGVTLISGHPMLAPAFIEALKKWEYKPFLKDGQPVAVVTRADWTVGTPTYSPAQQKALKDYYPTFQSCYRFIKQWDTSRADTAETTCREAVALADQLPNNRVLERSDARTFLAHSLYRQRKLDGAIPLYEKALEIREGYEHSETDADFADENANLARAYFAAGQPEKADPVYSRAVTIFKAAILSLPAMKDNYSARLRQTLLEYSKLKTARGQQDEAARLKTEADQIVSK
jgi:tetratricopeptide (TPR) repeat protein